MMVLKDCSYVIHMQNLQNIMCADKTRITPMHQRDLKSYDMTRLCVVSKDVITIAASLETLHIYVCSKATMTITNISIDIDIRI